MLLFIIKSINSTQKDLGTGRYWGSWENMGPTEGPAGEEKAGTEGRPSRGLGHTMDFQDKEELTSNCRIFALLTCAELFPCPLPPSSWGLCNCHQCGWVVYQETRQKRLSPMLGQLRVKRTLLQEVRYQRQVFICWKQGACCENKIHQYTQSG